MYKEIQHYLANPPTKGTVILAARSKYYGGKEVETFEERDVVSRQVSSPETSRNSTSIACLSSEDFKFLERSIERLRTIGSLMEKQFRVASWTVRTLTAPLLTVTGFAIYGLLGMLTPQLGELWARSLQYSSVGVLGLIFVYYGLRAVHLTEIANRVWKRAAEYSLIVSERRRLSESEE